jgi:hypothetical protein
VRIGKYFFKKQESTFGHIAALPKQCVCLLVRLRMNLLVDVSGTFLGEEAIDPALK